MDKGKMIACTQPRRVAAVSVANRVALETGCKIGSKVGYTVRFDDTTSRDTALKYMTDGMLLREAISDPKLSRYSVILLDEAHERTLMTDILFGVIKGVQKLRPELKVIIMSATLDAAKFSTYFDDCPVLYVQGRQYPVEILYTIEPQQDYVDSVFVTVLQIHQDEKPGDILVFLTGQEDIENVGALLQDASEKLDPKFGKLVVRPIFAALPPEQQMKVFEPVPKGSRKVVLATNIAETSITINGIRYVVDTGLVKAKTFNPNLSVESLMAQPVSQAQARQRTGRAGREAPGVCYRLFSEDLFRTLDSTTTPEIVRCNLASAVLNMKAMGVDDIIHFDFLDKPTTESLRAALMLIFSLGALDASGKLTTLGRRMARFPIEPQLAKTLISAERLGCVEEILTIVSMLSAPSIFFIPFNKREEVDLSVMKEFASLYGDHLTYLNVYKAYRQNKGNKTWCKDHFINMKSMKTVLDTRGQLAELCRKSNIEIRSSSDTDNIRKALVSGFFYNIAVLQDDGTYHPVSNRTEVALHPQSVLKGQKPKYVLYHELVKTKRYYLRVATVIEPEWAAEAAPTYFARTIT
ncbi:hypothetical protein, variant [Sphaeroforma arctica JP610]|nr:hypothetical protein, variant [Sphaeroforma arctica JP610]KNC79661.1 hypothetical protein, variant [Sphaeroforma arctica JP610]|eukprot:XP_014153563.1 hypothetical protein, variant [Sphaeroforma arctica JP610]